MKRFTQCVSIILVMVTLLVMPAYASEAFSQRSSNYFMKYSVYFHEISSSTVEVWFDVTAVGIMDKLGVSKIVVERSSDLVDWDPMKTYKMADYSQMIDENTAKHADCVSYGYSSGYYYRAIITLYAKDGSSYGEYDVTTAVFES